MANGLKPQLEDWSAWIASCGKVSEFMEFTRVSVSQNLSRSLFCLITVHSSDLVEIHPQALHLFKWCHYTSKYICVCCNRCPSHRREDIQECQHIQSMAICEHCEELGYDRCRLHSFWSWAIRLVRLVPHFHHSCGLTFTISSVLEDILHRTKSSSCSRVSLRPTTLRFRPNGQGEDPRTLICWSCDILTQL